MKNVGKLESFAFVSWFEKNTFDFNRHLQGIPKHISNQK